MHEKCILNGLNKWLEKPFSRKMPSKKSTQCESLSTLGQIRQLRSEFVTGKSELDSCGRNFVRIYSIFLLRLTFIKFIYLTLKYSYKPFFRIKKLALGCLACEKSEKSGTRTGFYFYSGNFLKFYTRCRIESFFSMTVFTPNFLNKHFFALTLWISQV